MGLFGSLFGNQQSQGQPAPAAPAAPPPDQNPYIPLTHTGALGQWLGVPKALQQHAAAVAAAEAWQAQHDYATHSGQWADPQSGSTAPMTISDGGTALAPSAPPTGQSYTSSPGLMDAIAAQAQGAPPPVQGGTSLLNTGPAPSMPSYEAMGLPRTRQQVAADALRLQAAGVDPKSFDPMGAYDWANPASKFDATPSNVALNNGELVRVLNGQATPILAPAPTLVQYTDPTTGAPVARFAATPMAAPINGAAAPGQSAPPPTFSGPQSSPQDGLPRVVASSPPGSRADRNNNPGNIRGGGNWQGMVGTDPQGFTQFDTPANGIRAAQINLANQTRLHGINTLPALIAKYAPASDSNDVAAYTARVAQASGLDPKGTYDFSDPQVQAKVLPAMFGVEGGGTPQTGQQASGSVQPPTTADDNSQYLAPGQMRNVNLGFGAGAAAGLPGDATKTGADYVATLPPAVKEMTTAILQGRQPFPTITTRSDPLVKLAARAAMHADPDFDGTAYDQRQGTVAATTSALKDNIETTANAQASLQHLPYLENQIIAAAKAAGQSNIPWQNELRNWSQGKAYSDPRVAPLIDLMGQYQDAYARASGGDSGATDHLHKEIEERLGDTSGPQSIQAVFDANRGAANDRLAQLQATAKQLQGSMGAPLRQTPAAPPRKSAQQFTEGQVYQDAKGNKARYSGGQWVMVQ